MITIACVRTGNKYGPEYVERLRNMVRRHYPFEHEIICLTDQPEEFEGVKNVPAKGLGGWWAKMGLFHPGIRGDNYTIYFDLDTVICDDITPLIRIEEPFGICANFTRLSGHPTWPCNYGSCVMTFEAGWGYGIWSDFISNRNVWTKGAGKYGDQWVIERLAPKARILQDACPHGFFLGRREISNHPDTKPDAAAVVIFAGNTKPSNCSVKWIKDEWR